MNISYYQSLLIPPLSSGLIILIWNLRVVKEDEKKIDDLMIIDWREWQSHWLGVIWQDRIGQTLHTLLDLFLWDDFLGQLQFFSPFICWNKQYFKQVTKICITVTFKRLSMVSSSRRFASGLLKPNPTRGELHHPYLSDNNQANTAPF